MTKKQGLAELGEFGLIERIRRRVGEDSLLRLGIGDDCSVQAAGRDQDLLTSTDLLIEGVHFDLAWTAFDQLGAKSVAVNVSDIAAMGGTPRSLHLGLAIPPSLSIENLDRFIQGFLMAAQDYKAVLAGGDTCRSSGPLVIAVTVQGEVAPGRAVARSGARSGDLVFVSGWLGDSALALRQLQGGTRPGDALAQRFHCPQARALLGRRLGDSGLASAMIDISDGLVADLGHILEASRCGATLQLEAIPLSAPFREHLCRNPETIELALTGGEDYELLFTAASESERDIAILAAEVGLPLTRIGSLSKEKGLRVIQEDGGLYRYRQKGFNHFAT